MDPLAKGVVKPRPYKLTPVLIRVNPCSSVVNMP